MGPALTRRHTKINILLEGGALDRAQMDYGPVHCKYLECLFEMRGKQTIIESVGLHFQSIEVRVCAYDARLFICWKYLLRGREKRNKERRGNHRASFHMRVMEIRQCKRWQCGDAVSMQQTLKMQFYVKRNADTTHNTEKRGGAMRVERRQSQSKIKENAELN
jgi:hypothetical protein